MLTQAIGHVQQWRRKALAHQCRSCNHLWALHLVYGSGGQLILCRNCGAPRAAQSDEEALPDTTADAVGKADV